MNTKLTSGFNAGKYLSLASLPINNPKSIEEFICHKRYTITPIEHDYAGKTPAMWNAAYKFLEMDAVMAMMVGKTENAKEILDELRKDPRYIGGGSGVGFKDENVKFVDELDPLANSIGAINLIQKLSSGKLKGWNTDGIGYRQSLEELLAKRGKTLANSKIVMIGAGGTANAIAFALAERGARIVVVNRTLSKAEELALRVNAKQGCSVAFALAEDALSSNVMDADVLINVSTKGASGDFAEYSALAPAKLPATQENISENLLKSQEVMKNISRTAVLSDIILRNEPTPFLKQAEEAGFVTLDGIPMVVNQGVEAFLIIHGDEVGRSEEVRAKLREIMREAASI